MAKGKKKDNAAKDRNKTDRDQALIEEGTAPETTKAEYDEEDFEDDNSKDEDSDARPDKGITNDKEVQEAAREVGHEPVSKKEKDLNLGEKVIREATRKSQSPASARVTRKEPSKASRASGKKARTTATRSAMQGKKKAAAGGRAKSSKVPTNKQKTKVKSGR
jgi:hypothetical protein